MVKAESFSLFFAKPKSSFNGKLQNYLKWKLSSLKWQNGRFEVKRDLDLAEFNTDSRTLHIDVECNIVFVQIKLPTQKPL